MRQAVRLRWSVTRLVSASPEGAAVFARGQSLCVRELGWEGNFQSRCWWDLHIPQEMGGVCVCVCVCVFSKTRGERTQLRPKLGSPYSTGDGCVCLCFQMCVCIQIVCVFSKAWGGDNTVEIQVRIPAGI